MNTLEKEQIFEQILQKQETNFKFERILVRDYELVLSIKESKSNLNAIVSIHNSSLGPALGGTRISPYPTFEKALEDVLRLSKAMTYKAAIADVGLGGGKSVIIADPNASNKKELLLAFGQALNHLNGLYICAEDMGCTLDDVMTIAQKTPYVTGLSHEKSSGDPGCYTAWGTFRSIQAVLNNIYGSDSLEGKKIAIQGLGNVGMYLVDYLFWNGAELILTDIDEKKLKKFAHKYGAKTVDPEKIYQVECDIFAPCARGAILNEMTIPSLRCRAVCGAANNQLFCNNNADQLQARNILYAPDFVVNAGGLLNVTQELENEGYVPKNPRDKSHRIYNTLSTIFEIAKSNKISPYQAAVQLADYRLKYLIGKRENKLIFHHSIKK